MCNHYGRAHSKSECTRCKTHDPIRYQRCMLEMTTEMFSWNTGNTAMIAYHCIDCGYQGIDLDEHGDCLECGSSKIEVLSGEKAKYVTDQYVF